MAKDKTLIAPGDHIVFEGDSLTSRRAGGALNTWPFLELMGWHETYAHYVSRLLFCLRPDLKLGFTHTAVGGSSCREVAKRLETLVLPVKPAWVVMTLGHNDARREIPLKEFRETMDAYARRVQEACGGRLLFLGDMVPCPGCPEEKVEARETSVPYYDVLKEVAGKFGGVYCPAGRALQAKARLLHEQHPAHIVYSDGAHLNVLGSIILAGEVIKALGVTW